MSGALAIVPARGGSKGIRGKNLTRLGGMPLIAHTIAAARSARSVGRVVVSTDSDAIARAARRAGADVPFRRPARLGTDRATTEAVIRHALDELEHEGELPELIVVLQPTSPLRTAADIDGALRLLRRSRAPSVVSVCPVEHPAEWMFQRARDGTLSPIVPAGRARRRQDVAVVYRLNGAIFAVWRDEFRRSEQLRSERTVSYVMPRERSIDIDEPNDLIIAEAWLRSQRR